MIDRIGAFSTENDIDLSWLIEMGAIYDEKKIGQQRNQSTGVVYIENDIEFSWPVRSSANYEEKYTG